MAVIYPEFLPCPTWSYGDGTEMFLNRTNYECGWTRQRKNIQDNYIQYNLSFLMDTREFNRWQQWVSENGYNWFSIKLDRVAGELEEETIRFITPFTFSYNAYDIVAVTVDAEQYNGKPNPPRQPEVPPESLPECQPYSCSAYEDYLIESDIAYWTTYSVIPADFPYPFATSEGQAGSRLLVYGQYVSAPQLISDWSGPAAGDSGTYVRYSTNTSTTANPPDFCDGTIDSIVSFDGEGGGNANGVIVRGTRPIANEIKAPFGDYTVSALICGYNFTNNIAIGGLGDWFIEGINKIWRFRRDGTDYRTGQSAISGVKISTIGATNDVRVTLQAASPTNDGYPDLVEDTFDVSNVANILTPIAATVESSQPYEAVVGGDNPNTGKYGVFIDITVTCSYGGTSVTVTNSQALAVGFTATSKPITNLGTEKPRLYEQAVCCLNGVLSFASLTWDDAVSADFVNELEIAYDRNFVEYTPPGYCSP